MRCLILGAGGFIGKNLFEMIINRQQDELVLFDKDTI